MKLSNDFKKAVNDRNRTEINKIFNEIFDKYIDLLFYNCYRLIGDKDVSFKIASETFLIIFKNITSVENLVEDLVYLNNENINKYLNNHDVNLDEYNDLLNSLDVSDEQLNLFVNIELYNRSLNDFIRYNKNLKKNLKFILYTTSLDSENVLELIRSNANYSLISSKIEMPNNKFYLRDAKIIRLGIISLVICVLLFIIAFVIACIPSGNYKVAQGFFYSCSVMFILGIILMGISYALNKYNNRK